jgi:hypothetical protein
LVIHFFVTEMTPISIWVIVAGIMKNRANELWRKHA